MEVTAILTVQLRTHPGSATFEVKGTSVSQVAGAVNDLTTQFAVEKRVRKNTSKEEVASAQDSVQES
jgi:hypothetical protein